MLVKNAVIKTFCNVVSKLIDATFVNLKIRAIIEKIIPPITADGIQYFSRNLIFFRKYPPK
ncbi:hypothetical protein SDC9_88965 [bioreactor metagenome]|uniref:Uncharacterized protein n=1 Tax=bioreactor metagenome TaxID=1076179 RepID=A0A644ZMZ1_9ZZZZ